MDRARKTPLHQRVGGQAARGSREERMDGLGRRAPRFSRAGRLMALGAAALLALTVGGVAGAQTPNVLKVATTANITTWDPVKSFSTEAFYLGNIYEQLLRINPPGSEDPYTPLLATSWETSD